MDKDWDNRRERRGPRGEYRGWTRRCKWFDQVDGTVVVVFEDTEAKIRRHYEVESSAQEAWELFKGGTAAIFFKKPG